MAIGPVQLLVVGFGQGEFHGRIRAELERLRDSDTVRVIDLLAIRKDADGNIERLQLSDLSEDEAMELGAIAGALIGLGAGGEEGGVHLADAWIHPLDLVTIGLIEAEEVEEQVTQ